jgi:hypothetical protein
MEGEILKVAAKREPAKKLDPVQQPAPAQVQPTKAPPVVRPPQQNWQHPTANRQSGCYYCGAPSHFKRECPEYNALFCSGKGSKGGKGKGFSDWGKGKAKGKGRTPLLTSQCKVKGRARARPSPHLLSLRMLGRGALYFAREGAGPLAVGTPPQ